MAYNKNNNRPLFFPIGNPDYHVKYKKSHGYLKCNNTKVYYEVLGVENTKVFSADWNSNRSNSTCANCRIKFKKANYIVKINTGNYTMAICGDCLLKTCNKRFIDPVLIRMLYNT